MNGLERDVGSSIKRGLIVILVGIIIWFSPVPAGVKPEAWHLLAIFAATIVGLILTPLPMGAVVILGVMMTGLTGILKVGQMLSGFANSTVWLIVAAFLIARGFIITGLGRRIAFHFIRAFGRKTLGLAYAIEASDLVLSPATPSNTARARPPFISMRVTLTRRPGGNSGCSSPSSISSSGWEWASPGGRSWGCGKPWSGGGENPPPPGFRPPRAAESHGQKMLHDFRKLADKSIDTLLSPWKSRR